METVKRKISLEDFKTRYKSHIPSYKDNTYHDKTGENRGMIPMDVVINSSMSIYQIINKLPHLFENNKYILRYWDSKNVFTMLQEFISRATYYKMCKRKDGNEWISCTIDFYDGTAFPRLDVVNTLPTTSGYTIGNVICLMEDNELCDKFTTYFRQMNTTHRFELDYLTFFKNLHLGQYSGFTVPFIECNFYLDSQFEDIGLYSSESKHWIPKKKYYLGDLVIYGDNLYKLIETEEGEDYYRGYLNEDTMMVEFDDPQDAHWRLIGITDTVESAVTSYKESQLSILTPYKRSYDDDAQLLPFTIDSNKNVYLLQNFEPKNIEVEAGGDIYADCLIEVKTYDADMTAINTFRFDSMVGKLIPLTAISSSVTYIEFTYIVHGKIVTDSSNTITSIDMTSGIRYNEKYVASLDTMTVNLNDRIYILTYLKIGDMILTPVEGDMKDWSEIRFNPITPTASTQYHIFKDDRLQGVHGVTEDNEDLYVTRGVSAAMERHSILMEVSSFDDLKNYRNGYFSLGN